MFTDISNVVANNNVYGGSHSGKIGVTLNGHDYMIKFPRHPGRKVCALDNFSLNEHIGSSIFRVLEVPTQNTQLVLRDGVLCVACEDFVSDSVYELIEFRKLMATCEPSMGIPDVSSDLDDILKVIRNHPLLSGVDNREEHFWTMFIIDALIGNTDRKVDNWGYLRVGQTMYTAPVYDNANCLNPTFTLGDMCELMLRPQLLKKEAYSGKVCAFTRKGKKLNPFHVLASGEFKVATDCLSVLDKASLDDVLRCVDGIDEVDPILSWLTIRVSLLRVGLNYRISVNH